MVWGPQIGYEFGRQLHLVGLLFRLFFEFSDWFFMGRKKPKFTETINLIILTVLFDDN